MLVCAGRTLAPSGPDSGPAPGAVQAQMGLALQMQHWQQCLGHVGLKWCLDICAQGCPARASCTIDLGSLSPAASHLPAAGMPFIPLCSRGQFPVPRSQLEPVARYDFFISNLLEHIGAKGAHQLAITGTQARCLADDYCSLVGHREAGAVFIHIFAKAGAMELLPGYAPMGSPVQAKRTRRFPGPQPPVPMQGQAGQYAGRMPGQDTD